MSKISQTLVRKFSYQKVHLLAVENHLLNKVAETIFPLALCILHFGGFFQKAGNLAFYAPPLVSDNSIILRRFERVSNRNIILYGGRTTKSGLLVL